MKIESKDIDIESLLNASYFHIPRFQRPYSWDSENINEFWNDLILSKGEEYFIGSMVVYKKEKQQFGVVDGQQRLTTITILLCVIRDSFSSLGDNDLAKGIHQLIERTDRNNALEYVLLTETSFPYFQEYIQKFQDDPDAEVKIKDEEKNLQNAHNIFIRLVANALKSVDEDSTIPKEEKYGHKIKKLTTIRNSILNLNIIFITLDKEDDAYLIFETLNTRGKDLALTDLVKNHFFKHSKKRSSVDNTKEKWNNLLETIHQSSADISTDTFIYHFWASRYDAIPLKKLFPKIRKTITKEQSKNYLNFLVGDSKIYRSIYESGFDWKVDERQVSRSLEAMQIFKLSQPIPATLSLVRAYRAGIIKYAKLRDTLKAIENFHFIFTAVTSSRSSGGISAMYSSFARKLFESPNSQAASDEIKILIQKLGTKVPSYEEFEVAFREITFTTKNSKQKKLVRYILRKISEHKKYNNQLDYAELTVEHIAPQSKIGNNEWTEQIVGSLGNLMFMDGELNRKLDRKPFSDKKRILIEDNCCPKFLLEKDEWGKDDILSHTAQMATDAYNDIWKIS